MSAAQELESRSYNAALKTARRTDHLIKWVLVTVVVFGLVVVGIFTAALSAALSNQSAISRSAALARQDTNWAAHLTSTNSGLLKENDSLLRQQNQLLQKILSKLDGG